MKVDILKFFIFLLLACLFLTDVYQPLRLTKYFLPAFAFIPYFFVSRLALQYKHFSYYSTFLAFYAITIAYLLIKVLLWNEFQIRFIANAIFILTPLLLIFLLSPFYKKENERSYVKLIFFGILVTFLLQQSKNIYPILSDLSNLRQAIISSEIQTENQLAFSLGLLLFYFIVERYPKKYIIICGIVFILSFKRIALAAFVISYAVYLFTHFMGRIEKRKFVVVCIGLIVNFGFIQLVFSIISGDFDYMIKGWTNLSTNHFLMGRQLYYATAIQGLGGFNWSGAGLGKIDTLLMFTFNQPQNLHSDILKTYLEFGVILFSLWVILLYYKTTFSKKGIAMLVYFNALMFTDNVFIYFDFMFFFYFFILIFQSKTSRPESENEIQPIPATR